MFVQVDASMLEKIRHKSWDLDVLSLETSRGLIRARSRALLKVRRQTDRLPLPPGPAVIVYSFPPSIHLA